MKLQLTILLFTINLMAFGQVDPTIWDSLRTIEADNYELKVPYKWRQMPAEGWISGQMFEASGLALPIMHNGSPLIVVIFIITQECNDLEDCKDKCLGGYRTNPDREFPENFKDGQEKVKLSSGQDAYFLNTRFYRRSKGLNQSRFDLIAYSEKAKTGYMYTVSVQYGDEDYKYESDSKLVEFSKQLYSYFKLWDR